MEVNEGILKCYLFYSSLLILKFLLTDILSSLLRMSKGIFANPEDAACSPQGLVSQSDPEIQRWCRALRNDLENILPFLFLGGALVASNPGYGTALWCFRLFFLTRVAHTVLYLKEVR
eukprot:TCALIF_05768-PA protein Name:"Similar to PTGES Prostaglandin E synthase (Bos taurus)" AED:0.43 eAED:0.43 QI:162/1/0.5/1/0/0/2/0/117